MTTAVAARGSDLGRGHLSFVGALESEWIKLRSLRSTWFSLLAVVLITDGLGTLFSVLHTHSMERGLGPNVKILGLDATQVSLRGVFLAQLAIGVLGVLMSTGEYTTGMIRSSLAAVPRRRPVLLAKAVVFAVPVFVVAGFATLTAFVLGQQAQASTHAQASFTTPGAGRAIVGAAIYLVLIGLLGLGLGFVIRNTAGGIAALFGVVLVAPLLAQALPQPYANDVAKYLPLSAGQRIIATGGTEPDLLSPWAGIGVLVLYVVAALGVGAVMLSRRDA